jgi:hypothetical protein
MAHYREQPVREFILDHEHAFQWFILAMFVFAVVTLFASFKVAVLVFPSFVFLVVGIIGGFYAMYLKAQRDGDIR